ncbi:MAG: pyridoxine 5'-phosphate synthase [Candidatus Omnitrophica bacterium]|nr:pyridoxine 5'-phosphate synthase [Candidatus Omnitrophota bacterium]
MKLGVNIDHVATLRQARLPADVRGTPPGYPDPVWAAGVCQRAGAYAVVMHLREDRRHIQDQDLFRVKEILSIKLNLEMSIAPSVRRTAARLSPGQITLVPERRAERTTESGLDLFKKSKAIRACVDDFSRRGVLVSLFIDADSRQIQEAKRIGAHAIELHTGTYANQPTQAAAKREWLRLKEAARLARSFGLVAHAGHGLDYENVKAVAKIRELEELNIGYSIVTRALVVGLDEAVREMKGLIA